MLFTLFFAAADVILKFPHFRYKILFYDFWMLVVFVVFWRRTHRRPICCLQRVFWAITNDTADDHSSSNNSKAVSGGTFTGKNYKHYLSFSIAKFWVVNFFTQFPSTSALSIQKGRWIRSNDGCGGGQGERVEHPGRWRREIIMKEMHKIDIQIMQKQMWNNKIRESDRKRDV